MQEEVAWMNIEVKFEVKLFAKGLANCNELGRQDEFQVLLMKAIGDGIDNEKLNEMMCDPDEMGMNVQCLTLSGDNSEKDDG